MDRMQKVMFVAIAVLAILLFNAPTASADPFVIDFSNLSNAKIAFDGLGNFRFLNNASAYSFNTTSQSGFADDGGDEAAVDLLGKISGVFAIGPCGGCSKTTVTGTGVLTISDGFGGGFTADVDWISLSNQPVGGTGNALNVGAVMNLSSMTYTAGSTPNMNLAALANQPLGGVSVSFTFIPGLTIDQLKAAPPDSAAYSGQLVVPEPTSLMLLGAAFLSLGLASRRRGERI